MHIGEHSGDFLLLDTTEEFDAAYISIEKPFSYIHSPRLFWSIIPYHSLEERCIYILGPVFLQDIDERVFKQRMGIENRSVESQVRLMKMLHEITVYGLSDCSFPAKDRRQDPQEDIGIFQTQRQQKVIRIHRTKDGPEEEWSSGRKEPSAHW